MLIYTVILDFKNAIFILCSEFTIEKSGVFGMVPDDFILDQLLKDILGEGIFFEFKVIKRDWIPRDKALVVLRIIKVLKERMFQYLLGS